MNVSACRIAAVLACCAVLHAQAREAGGPQRPRPSAAAPLSPAEACLAAIEAAELVYHTPPGLLLAIARTESGRFDLKSAQVQPWPWSMNVNGAGVQVASKAEAVTYTTDTLKQPNASIDMGCMQVNNIQHPAAFLSLDDAFDPRSNVMYAAKFLTQLYAQTGDWLQATGYYHSHTPALAIPYLTAVQARMKGPRLMPAGFTFGGFAPPAPPLPSPEMVMRAALKSAWGATLTDAAAPPPAPLAKSAEHSSLGKRPKPSGGVFSRAALQ